MKINGVKKVLLIIIALFSLQSCESEDEFILHSGNYLLFGHFYGECFGEYCIEIFKIEDGVLYEDKKDTYPSGSTAYIGDFVKLDQQLYEKVSDIVKAIPEELLNTDSGSIGCPDCADGGGIYIEVRQDGESQYWMIDQELSKIPGHLHPLVKKAQEKVALLQ
jgi:hypothetical protein